MLWEGVGCWGEGVLITPSSPITQRIIRKLLHSPMILFRQRPVQRQGQAVAMIIAHIRHFLESVVGRGRNRRNDECNYAIERIKMIVRTKTHRNQNV